MADSDKSTEYAINADPAGFVAGMDKVQAKAKDAGRQVEASFKAIENSMASLSNMFSSITSVVGTMTAVIAGGAAFKEVIGASVAWTGEAKKLSMALGTSTERASVMMVAMRHLGIDSDVMTTASGKMTKQIFTNGQAFEKLGVSVKDSAGQYRPTLDIMGEVNAKLKEIKNPIEQNIAGAQAYGKSWAEVRGILRLTTDELKAAEQKTKDLGLVVGDEGVAQAKKYKESLNDMKLIMTSIEVQVGASMLPIFVKLGSWLGSVGPMVAKVMGAAMSAFDDILRTVGETVLELWVLIRSGFTAIGEVISSVMGTDAPDSLELFVNALKVIEVAFVGLQVVVRSVVEVVKGLIEALVVNVMRWAGVIERALHGDFAGAKAAWKAGTDEIASIAERHAQKLVDIALAGRSKMDDILMRPAKAGAPIKDKTPDSGGPTYDFAKDGREGKDKSRMHEWEAKLGADKEGFAKEQAIAGTAHEFSTQMERDYWKRLLDTAGLSTEERSKVASKYYAASATIRKDEFDATIAGEKASLENFKNNHLARLEIAEQIHRQNVERFGAESKEAKASMADIFKEQRAFADQTIATNKVVADSQRDAQLAGIDAAEQAAQQEVALGRMTEARMLEQEEAFEAKRYQIKMQAMIERQTSLHGLDEDPVALAQIHAQIEALEDQHQKRLTSIRNKAAVAQNAPAMALYSNIERGMGQVIASTLKGTTSITGMLQGMFSVVTNALAEMLAQQAAKWLANLVMTEASSKISALGQITANAGVAGAAATASAAAIPLVGWMLAPEAGLAASAAAMAYMPMASARGGYDIPAGLNPVTQLHEKEMVLPAAQADAVRDMAGGGGGGRHTINYHDYSGRLSQEDIRKNAGVIAKALKDHAKK